MRDLIQKIDNILKESHEQHTSLFEIGDEFGISFSEDLEIATTIVGFVEDGIIVELDDTAISIMEQHGARFTEGYLEENLRDPKQNPCWKGYHPVGTKKKNGKTVPNCVPKESIEEKTVPGKTFRQQTLPSLNPDPVDDAERFGKKHHDSYEQDFGKEEIKRIISQNLDVLRDREKELLRLRFWEGMTLAEVAKEFNIGVERTRQIEAKILRKLRDRFRARDLNPDAFEQISNEAEYQGRDVPLNKPMSNTDGKSKSKVYVKDPQTGNVKKVTFGDPNMRIKKSNPERRKSFRARHNCSNPGPKTKARYWSCRAW